jgi:hypothetical protein
VVVTRDNMPYTSDTYDTEGVYVVVATDSLNNETRVTFTIDTQKPEISHDQINLRISADDNLGLTYFMVLRKTDAKGSYEEVFTSETVFTYTYSQEGYYEIIARDTTGNIGVISFTYGVSAQEQAVITTIAWVIGINVLIGIVIAIGVFYVKKTSHK